MTKRLTHLDKAIQKLDDQIAVLTHARDVLVAQRTETDLEARHQAKARLAPVPPAAAVK